jgi:RNA polymerase sigma factor (sigma-70 family)
VVKEGAAFEVEVREAVAGQLPKLGVTAECVFQGKTYPAKNHGADVPADLSIEVGIAGHAPRPLLWIWECKHHLARPIDVEEVQLFHAKLQEIAGDNVRGTIVSRGPFTKDALQYAQAHSIGTARFTSPPDQDTEISPEEARYRNASMLGIDEWSFLSNRLVAYFRHMGGVEYPEDLAQDTVIRLFEKLQAGMLIVDLRAYALGIAQNVWRDHRKKLMAEERKFQGHGLLHYDEEETVRAPDRRAAPPWSGQVRDEWDAIDSKLELERCLQELSPADRELLLDYYSGEPPLDLAKRLSITSNSLRIRVYRIRSRLEQALRTRPLRKPLPVIEATAAKSYASAQLAALILSQAARKGEPVSEEVWERIGHLPEFEVDRASFSVEGDAVVYRAWLKKTGGQAHAVWVRVAPADTLEQKLMRASTILEGARNTTVVYGTTRADVTPAQGEEK